LEIAAYTQIQAHAYASSRGTKVAEIPVEVVEKTAKKFQGQAEHLFAYYNFESWRKYYGLIDEFVFTKYPEELGEKNTQEK